MAAAPASARVESQRLAPGVRYESFAVPTSHGRVRVHLVTVDLDQPGVRASLLYPGAVTRRETVAQMARAQGVVAAINGDFFDISEGDHPGVPATGAATGPAVLDGTALKAAVPSGQRFGWTPAPADTAEVFGVGVDGVARTGRLKLRGKIRTPQREMVLGGLNQYALPEDAIGVFTPQWGVASRQRATCGADDYRGAPCSSDTREVLVRDGHVVSGSDAVSGGPIQPGTFVLVGREAGADRLRNLRPGMPVSVDYSFDSSTSVPFAFALGAHRLLADSEPLPGLDRHRIASRSAVGIADHGHTLKLLATDGGENAEGLTPRELAKVLADRDCEQAVYLDGGGSTTLVTRDPLTGIETIRNGRPRSGRPVPNGVAIFSGPRRGALPLLPPVLGSLQLKGALHE